MALLGFREKFCFIAVIFIFLSRPLEAQLTPETQRLFTALENGAYVDPKNENHIRFLKLYWAYKMSADEGVNRGNVYSEFPLTEESLIRGYRDDSFKPETLQQFKVKVGSKEFKVRELGRNEAFMSHYFNRYFASSALDTDRDKPSLLPMFIIEDSDRKSVGFIDLNSRHLEHGATVLDIKHYAHVVEAMDAIHRKLSSTGLLQVSDEGLEAFKKKKMDYLPIGYSKKDADEMHPLSPSEKASVVSEETVSSLEHFVGLLVDKKSLDKQIEALAHSSRHHDKVTYARVKTEEINFDEDLFKGWILDPLSSQSLRMEALHALWNRAIEDESFHEDFFNFLNDPQMKKDDLVALVGDAARGDRNMVFSTKSQYLYGQLHRFPKTIRDMLVENYPSMHGVTDMMFSTMKRALLEGLQATAGELSITRGAFQNFAKSIEVAELDRPVATDFGHRDSDFILAAKQRLGQIRTLSKILDEHAEKAPSDRFYAFLKKVMADPARSVQSKMDILSTLSQNDHREFLKGGFLSNLFFALPKDQMLELAGMGILSERVYPLVRSIKTFLKEINILDFRSQPRFVEAIVEQYKSPEYEKLPAESRSAIDHMAGTLDMALNLATDLELIELRNRLRAKLPQQDKGDGPSGDGGSCRDAM